MTDFFTHLAGQVIQPSREVYPAISGPFAPGPDVPAAGPVPEPPVLDSTLQTVPAALADRTHTENNSPAAVEEPGATFAAQALRFEHQEGKPIPSQISLPADGNEAKHTPAEISGAQRTSRPIPPAIDLPAINAPLAEEAGPPAISPSAIRMDRHRLSDEHPSIPGTGTDQALPEDAERYPSTLNRSEKSLPELEPVDPPEAGWKGRSVTSKTHPNVTDAGIHTPLQLIKPAVVSRFASIVPSPGTGAGGPDPIQTKPLTKENNPGEPPQNAPQAQAQTAHSQARLPQTPREGATETTPRPEKAAGQSAHPPELNLNSVIRPPFDHAITQTQLPHPTQRAVPKSQADTLPLVTTSAAEMALPLIPLPLSATASSHPEPETGRSDPIWIAPLINEAAATTASILQPDHATRRTLQAEQVSLVPPDARKPGKAAESPARSPAFNPNSTIRPVIPAEAALGEKTNASRAEAAGSTVPTVRLTIGRIVVKAGPPAAPAASTPVPTRRQPSVSLSDYLARHGRNK